MAAAAEIEVGTIDDFPPGALRIVDAGRFEIGVLRHSDGRFFAMRNHCPHKGAPVCRGPVGGTMLPSEPGELVYGLDGLVVRCPWHGFEFSVETGRCLFTDTDLALRTYPVGLRDRTVVVRLR